MNNGFEQISKGTVSQSPAQTFSTDYPQRDLFTRWKKVKRLVVSQKYESKVKWIIDANQIADPTKVYVGKELFVPQKCHGEIDFKIG